MHQKIISLVALFSSGCLLPFAVPPSKVDMSGGAHLGQGGQDSAFHLNAGLSLNSAQLDAQAPIDLQVGYALHAPTNTELSQGVYGAFSLFTPANRFLRGEIGARGEVLVNQFGEVSIGSFLRFGGELFHSGTGPFESHSSDGFIVGQSYGTGGFELFMDVGRLQGIGAESATFIGVGAAVRIPATVGLFFGWPW